MPKKRTSLDNILPKTESLPVAASTAPSVKTKAKPDLKKPSLYLKPPVYQQLRRLAFEEEKKMHDLLMESIDLLFEHRGMPAIDELLNDGE